MRKLRKLALLVRSGELVLLLRLIARRLYSESVSLGLRREVSEPLEAPRPRMALTIRPLEPDDVPLFTVSIPNLDRTNVMDRVNARLLIESGIRQCYVAVTPDGHPCYMQCLIESSQNGKLRRLYGNLVPPLQQDEGLLEAAFSLEKYRGRGLMLQVIPELLARARQLGLRRLILFASVNNLPMLRACRWAGFVPYTERRQSHRLFHRRVTFRPLPDGTPYPLGVASGQDRDRPSGGRTSTPLRESPGGST
jgi:hypothetical protein